MSVIRGKSAVLHCHTTGSPTPQLEWVKDGVPLPQSFRIRFQNNKQILNISRLEIQDSGLYECQASNKVGSVTARNNVSVFGEIYSWTCDHMSEIETERGSKVDISLRTDHNWGKDCLISFKIDTVS